MEQSRQFTRCMGRWLITLLLVISTPLAARALQRYACYTPSNKTLTFYYDDLRSSRTGTTYNLNTGNNIPAWYEDLFDDNTWTLDVENVVFDASFADTCPTSTYGWFASMKKIQSISGLEYLNTTWVTNMAWMFASCTNLRNLDLRTFSTSSVTNMSYMFYDCESLKSLDLSHFNTYNVTNMSYMFSKCFALPMLDLSGFNNTSKVTNMEYMFAENSNLTTIHVGNGWSTAAVTKSSNMFMQCTRLVGGKGTAYNASHVDKAYAHIDGGTSNPGYFTKPRDIYACYTPSNTTLTFYYDALRTSRPGTTYEVPDECPPLEDVVSVYIEVPWNEDGTNANVTKVVFDASFADVHPTLTSRWFYGMTNLQSITGMNYLNTSEVIDMMWMFGSCSKLTSLDLSHFDTSSAIFMANTFNGCSGLTQLDLSGFNTSQVTEMLGLFKNCSNLTTIYVGSGWTTANVDSSVDMFRNCTKLKGGKGTAYNASHVDKAYAHIDGGTSNPGYFTAKNAAQRGDVNHDGAVDVADVTALIAIILNSQPVDYAVADMNDDDEVDVADVTSLIAFILSN